MKPVFKTCNQGQITLFPVNLDSKIPQDSPVRLVNQIVDNLDISKIIDTYKGGFRHFDKDLINYGFCHLCDCLQHRKIAQQRDNYVQKHAKTACNT